MELLELTDISKSFNDQFLYSNVNLIINPKDKIALVGDNGTGKTTLLKIISGTEPPDTGTITTKDGIKITYLDQFHNISETLSIQEILDTAFSDILKVKDTLTLLEKKMETEEDITEILETYTEKLEEFESMGGYGYLEEQTKFAQIFGFTKNLDQKFSTLSGGERQYLRLALTIFGEGDLIILDEPLTFFDKNKIYWLSKFIKESPKTFLIISHDVAFFNEFTNKVFDIDNFTVKTYNCTYKAYLKEKLNYLEEVLKENDEKDQTIEHKQKVIERTTLWRDKAVENAHRYAVTIKRLEREINSLEASKTVLSTKSAYQFADKKTERPKITSDILILEISNVYKSFGAKEIYKNLNLQVYSKEHVCIIGANSMGKTTLFKLITGSQQPDSGEIIIKPETEIAFIPQEITYESDKITVFKYCKNETKLGDIFLEEAIDKLYDGNQDFRIKRLYMLSGGEKKRLQIMINMLSTSNLLLIDEPTTFMDEYSKLKIIELINQYDGAVILVTHDKNFRKSLDFKSYDLIDKKLVPIQ